MAKEEEKNNWGGKLLGWFSRYKFVLLIAALGAVFLLWPSQGKADNTAAPVKNEANRSNVEELEQSMAEILSKMEGVGRAEVMLTLQSGSELVLAMDSALQYSGSVQSPENYDRSSQPVTVSKGSGEEAVVVTQENSPKYRGALIVCDGGGSDKVRLQIAEAVSALTGLGTDRIAVVRRQSGTADN